MLETRGSAGEGCIFPVIEVLTSAGAVEVTAPRVCGKRTGPVTGERGRFCPAIVPPWARKTPKVTAVLPLLYVHGLSGGDFVYLWADGLLRDWARRGMRAPVLAASAGALGFRNALAGSAHPGAKKALAGVLIERPEPAAA